MLKAIGSVLFSEVGVAYLGILATLAWNIWQQRQINRLDRESRLEAKTEKRLARVEATRLQAMSDPADMRRVSFTNVGPLPMINPVWNPEPFLRHGIRLRNGGHVTIGSLQPGESAFIELDDAAEWLDLPDELAFTWTDDWVNGVSRTGRVPIADVKRAVLQAHGSGR